MCVSEFDCVSSTLSRNVLIKSLIESLFEVGVLIILKKRRGACMITVLMQINKKNDMYVDWKTKSTTTEMYNNKKINFKTFEKNSQYKHN